MPASSAWGKWSEVLKRNPDAVQVGLTATPRRIKVPKDADAEDLANDERMLADNLRYFGEPVYEYDLAQAMEDGYLAACEIRKRDIFLEDMKEAEHHTGITSSQLQDKKHSDPITGRAISVNELEKKYVSARFEALLKLPDRVKALASDLFEHLLAHGGPEQKTVVFCASDSHADEVASAMNNLYAAWCKKTRKTQDKLTAILDAQLIDAASVLAFARAELAAIHALSAAVLRQVFGMADAS